MGKQPQYKTAKIPVLFHNRKCLKCGKEFPSNGVGNRICHPCSGLKSGSGIKVARAKALNGNNSGSTI